eukprot:CAMPEP_0172164358 /NCGR_PEP_ID=MMETSP1050-20130122/7801_1 /TAXON_ID=233186 /ORGANISM="Cryptomonas curvata, Strain CCAP979/52" /LENGTH=37 /DNA_ID= /DNA_START= /DNA_END= /DNA_ORIENTATION=
MARLLRHAIVFKVAQLFLLVALLIRIVLHEAVSTQPA